MRKHNPAMKARPLRLHPFERAAVRRVWSERTVNAQIHALTGDDGATVRDKAGTLFYVVLGAAQVERMSAQHPDVRILRGSANTLAEIGDTATDLQRASIASGLEAVNRLVAALKEESLFLAATHAKMRLEHGPVTLADFEMLAAPQRRAA